MSDGINPRFAAYARVHGRSVEGQVEHDRIEWKGGSMVGFILWNRKRIQEFGKAHPEAFAVCGTGSCLVDHAAYNAWLDRWVEENI